MISALLALVMSAQPTLTVSGDLPKPAALSVADLEAVGETSAGKKVRGASLQQVLKSLGHSPWPMGKGVDPALKHSGHRKAVIAHARDGFEALFSTAELDEVIGTTRVLAGRWSAH